MSKYIFIPIVIMLLFKESSWGQDFYSSLEKIIFDSTGRSSIPDKFAEILDFCDTAKCNNIPEYFECELLLSIAYFSVVDKYMEDNSSQYGIQVFEKGIDHLKAALNLLKENESMIKEFSRIKDEIKNLYDECFNLYSVYKMDDHTKPDLVKTIKLRIKNFKGVKIINLILPLL